MSELLNSITSSRGWEKIQSNVIEPFSNASSWFFNTLFRENPIAAIDYRNRGWGNITAFLAILIPLAVAMVVFLPALAWHSLKGFIDAIRWTSNKSWNSQYKKTFRGRDEAGVSSRNNLQEFLAIPGYL